ncbi:MAG TPA: c-type cytochrome [Clostridia bacterium]|nr:c-type cytochrome [Clostridia bacterium]
MNKKVLTAVVLLCVSGAAFSQRQKTAQPAKAVAAQLERGRYLVDDVGQCGDCHTPRNEKGEFIKEQWLAGSPLMFTPSVPIPDWTPVAPGIAGLPGWETADAVSFLSTGTARNRGPARPPMPHYRLTKPDAEAVVAYLRSLRAPGATAADTSAGSAAAAR